MRTVRKRREAGLAAHRPRRRPPAANRRGCCTAWVPCPRGGQGQGGSGARVRGQPLEAREPTAGAKERERDGHHSRRRRPPPVPPRGENKTRLNGVSLRVSRREQVGTLTDGARERHPSAPGVSHPPARLAGRGRGRERVHARVAASPRRWSSPRLPARLPRGRAPCHSGPRNALIPMMKVTVFSSRS